MYLLLLNMNETTAEGDNIYSPLAALGRVDVAISRLYWKVEMKN